MASYPVDLRVHGWPCLVVGGGAVATRRIGALVDAGGQVTVVAPRVDAAVRLLAERGTISWRPRRYRKGDCHGARLVLVAVDDPKVGRRVARDARRAGALCNAADQPDACDFFLGATARAAALTLGVWSDGTAPGLAAALRDELRPHLTRCAHGRLETYASRRRSLRRLMRTEPPRQRIDRLRKLLSPATQPSAGASRVRVFFVGAGPGSVDLMTRRAHQLVESADCVLVDALVAPACYEHARGVVEIVGRRAGAPAQDRAALGRRLVALASAQQTVVRLKGGDPALFAQLTVEYAPPERAGLAYEIVPGVTSAVAAAAAIQLPLTDGATVHEVVLVSGHPRGSAIHLPRFSADRTVVAYMALGSLAELAGVARASGYPANLTCAVASSVSLPAERWIVTTLEALATHSAAARLEPPAVVLLGGTLQRAMTLERTA